MIKCSTDQTYTNRTIRGYLPHDRFNVHQLFYTAILRYAEPLVPDLKLQLQKSKFKTFNYLFRKLPHS